MSHKLQRSVESDSDSGMENVYCFCQKDSSGCIIDVTTSNASINSFIIRKCVGIKRAPQGTWFCSTCKRRK